MLQLPVSSKDPGVGVDMIPKTKCSSIQHPVSSKDPGTVRGTYEYEYE
jgi:hypothetical protein